MLGKDWQEVQFGQICKNISKRVADPKNSGYERYVGLEHLETLEPHVSKWSSVDDVSSSMNLFSVGQILFGRRNWYLRRVAVPDFDGICSADIYVLESIEGKIIKDFLPIFMHTDQFFEKNMMYSTGSMSTRVKWSNLEKIKFVIPSISKQKTIVKIIQKIDDTVLKTEDMLQKTIDFKKSRSNELLTKGIGHDKFKKIKWYFGQEVVIPKDWKVHPLSKFCKLRKPIEIKSNLYVGLEHIGQGNNKLVSKGESSDYKSSKHIFLKNDVLYGKLRPLLNKVWVADSDGYCSTDILSLQHNEKILPTILMMMLSGPKFYSYAISTSAGTRMPRTNWTDMKKFKMFEIPIPEQEKIASIILDIDKQLSVIENYLKKLKEIRKSVIHSRLKIPLIQEEKLLV
ncbi:MAG: restriction endonuclease subunit S [Nitrosopumilaceae archaeon]|nr:restriction endonuclease subunit S [Nitrosopumilaceae archaeon]